MGSNIYSTSPRKSYASTLFIMKIRDEGIDHHHLALLLLGGSRSRNRYLQTSIPLSTPTEREGGSAFPVQ